MLGSLSPFYIWVNPIKKQNKCPFFFCKYGLIQPWHLIEQNIIVIINKSILTIFVYYAFLNNLLNNNPDQIKTKVLIGNKYNHILLLYFTGG